MTERKLYALTDSQAARIKRALLHRDAEFESGNYAAASRELTPLDADAAVDRMARAILKVTYGGDLDLLTYNAWDIARGDARAALAALLGGEQP